MRIGATDTDKRLVFWRRHRAHKRSWSCCRAFCRCCSGCRVCQRGWSGCRACHRGWSGIDCGSVSTGRDPAHCSGMCLFGNARVITPLFQAFRSFLGFCTFSGMKFQSFGGAPCSRCLPRSSHTPCHSSLSCLWTHLWMACIK